MRGGEEKRGRREAQEMRSEKKSIEAKTGARAASVTFVAQPHSLLRKRHLIAFFFSCFLLYHRSVALIGACERG